MAQIRYLDFDLRIERSAEGYIARVLNSPAGQASIEFKMPFSDLELENFLLRVGRTRRGVRRLESPEMEAAKGFGGRLFDAVFGHEIRGCLRSSMDEASRQGAGLRLRLHLGDVPELGDLPWEYLHNRALNRFLVLSTETPLVRYMDLPERIRPLTVKLPLRVLIMISSPSDYPPLDVEREWTKLKEALSDLEKRGLVILERMTKPTLGTLQRRLRRGEYHIFHFVGHGAFDERAQDGVLLLEDEEGRGRSVSGQYLGTLMHDERTLRLAILNACEGARTSLSDPFAGTAQSLVQQGIPAVIAMQFEITDEAAIAMAHEFYAALADGYPVDAALAEARKAIFAQGNDVEWGTPVLYLRASDGRIFDVERASEEERQQAQIAALFDEAQAAMTREAWQTAIEKLQALLALEPAHTEARAKLNQAQRERELASLYAKGREHYMAGRPREALEYLRRVRNMGGAYKDVERMMVSAEQSSASQMVAPTPTPQPAQPKSSSWLRTGVPLALVALLLLCCGGYAAYRVLPGLFSQPTPAVVKRTTPLVPEVKPSPVSISTPVPATPTPTRMPTPTPTMRPTPVSVDLALQLGGDPFNDPRLVDAILVAVPWAQLSQDLYPGQTVNILAETESKQYGYELTAEMSYDPEMARMLLAEAGYPDGLSLYLVYSSDNSSIATMAGVMEQELSGIGFLWIDAIPVSEDQVEVLLSDMAAAGETFVILFTE
jgi:hypothetical protein